MKRNCFLFALLCLLFAAPSTAPARPISPVMVMEDTELPANVVAAVLQEVENRTEYTQAQLTSWYQVGRVTIDVVNGDDYRVTILDDDGGTEIVLIDNL